jgi:hypothetical protein
MRRIRQVNRGNMLENGAAGDFDAIAKVLRNWRGKPPL